MSPSGRKQRFEFDAISLDPQSEQSQYRQLENQIRQAITKGLLRSGTRVPSSRQLAAILGISRNTVSAAYEQLQIEGLLESVVGSGTRVSSSFLQFEQNQSTRGKITPRTPSVAESLSETGKLIQSFCVWSPHSEKAPRPFRPHLPDLEAFPTSIWNRLASEQTRHAKRHLEPSDPQGYEPLRSSIADYMAVTRGVTCTKDQVIITSGAQQGLALVTQVLLNPGDSVWVEEPGNMPANQLLNVFGMRTVPIQLDHEGIDIAKFSQQVHKPKLIYVTPNCQWPMAITMSLNRRLQLLAESHRQASWILEDDYNGEFRYHGRPLPALCSLDQSGRTIYMGTFSKYLFPSIRLGYLVVPAQLREVFTYARWLLDRGSPTMLQQVLHRFMESGEFLKHLRRMRVLYQERRRVVYEGLCNAFDSVANIYLPDSGMHVVVHGKSKNLDDRLTRAAERSSIEFHAVKSYSMRPNETTGLVLGFAAFDAVSIEKALRDWHREYRIAKD